MSGGLTNVLTSDPFSKSAVKKRASAFEKAEFAKNYVPKKSFHAKLQSDVKDLFKGMLNLPKGIAQMTGQMTGRATGGVYKPELGVLGNIERLQSLPRDEAMSEVSQGNKAMLKSAALSLIPGGGLAWLPGTEHIKPLERFKQSRNLGVPIQQDVLNKLWFDSLFRNTAKWAYNPAERAKEWWAHPLLTSFEDFANLIIPMEIAKGLGIPLKVSRLARYGKAIDYGLPKGGMSIVTGAHKIPLVTKYGTLTAFGRATKPMVKGLNKTKANIYNYIKPRLKLSEMINKFQQSKADMRAGILSGKKLKLMSGVSDDLLKTEYVYVQEGWAAPLSFGDDAYRIATDYTRQAAMKETYRFLRRGHFGKVKIFKPGAKLTEVEKLYTQIVKPGTKLTAAEKIYHQIAKGFFGDKLYNTKTGTIVGGEGFKQVIEAQYGPFLKQFGLELTPKNVLYLQKMGIKPAYFMHIARETAETVGKQASKNVSKAAQLGTKLPRSMRRRTQMNTGWFEKDARLIIPKADMESRMAIMQNELYKQVSKVFGKELGKRGELMKGYIRYYPAALEHMPAFKLPFAKMIAKKQIPEWVSKELKAVLVPGAAEKFFRATFDKGAGVWKMSVLALSPRWMFNNFMGNAILNSLGGVSPIAYIRGARLLKQARRLAKSKGWPIERAYNRLGIPKGAYEGGIYKRAVEKIFAELGFSVTADPRALTMAKKFLGYNAVKDISSRMYHFNTGIETFFRTAHYVDKMAKGYSKIAAVKSINEFLFDYSGMTVFEKAFVRRIDLFWIWHKNITRLAVTYPIKHPTRTMMVGFMQRISKDEEDYRFVQDWVKGLVKTPFTSQGQDLFLSTTGMNPFSDVGIGLGNMNPLLKMIVERGTGTQLFKGRGFTSPYPNIEGGVEKPSLPSLGRHLGNQFPQVRLIESMFRPYARYDTGQPMINKETGEYKYPKNRLLEIAKIFGISLTPYNIGEMQQRGMERAYRGYKQEKNYMKLIDNSRQRGR